MKLKFILLVFWGIILSFTQSQAQLNIVGITPPPNANYVAPNANIEVTFGQNIEGTTLNNNSVIVRGHYSGVLSGTLSGGGTNTIIFDPDNDFLAGEIISVTITTQLANSFGQTLLRGHTYSFTTITAASPLNPPTFAQRDIVGGGIDDARVLDMEGDDDLDVLGGSDGTTELTFLSVNDGEDFCSQNLSNFRNVEVFDIDGDGDFDSFGATGAFDTEINWFENDGSDQNFAEQFLSAEDPWTLTGGDLDSDGDIDVVAPVILPNRVLWFSNDGTGGFSSAMNIPTTFTGGSDSYFYVVDINSDGAMDILAFHLNDLDLVWYENDGSQNFTEILIMNMPTRQRLGFADIDDDGDMDIASTSTQTPPSLSWFENDGSENFVERTVAVTATSPLFNVNVADVDGDLDMDLFAGIFWFENDGSENFTQRDISPGLTGFARSIDHADMDLDGDMDLITEFRWYENGIFMNITSTSPFNASLDVPASANINITFNQFIDIATVNNSSIQVFSEKQGIVTGAFSGGGTNTITFDPDNDFLPGDRIEVSVNEGVFSTSGHNLAFTYGFRFNVQASPVASPQFISNSVFTHSANVSGVDVADIDGDGDADLISSSSTELLWHENDGSGSFNSIPIITSGTPVGVFAFDQNEDGHMDIIVENSGSNALLYTNDGSQNFTESTLNTNLDIHQLADVDRDGDRDLVVLSASNGVLWLSSRCNLYTGGQSTIPQIASNAVKGNDMDNDGDMDFIAASSSGPAFYEFDGFSTFSNLNIDGNSTTNLDLADLDQDGDPDPIFVETNSAITWFENRLLEASMDFGARQEIGVLNMDPRAVVAIDIDGDGDADVAAVSRNDDKAVWYENRLNEVTSDFAPEQLLPQTADGPVDVVAADMDGDGDMDLVTISDQDDELIWFENTASGAAAIIFTAQPQNATICEGANTSFGVTATGDTGLTYQWQVDDGTGFTDVLNGGVFSNATTTMLDITSATAGMDGWQFQCVVSGDNAPDATSNPATLTIDLMPGIITQPTDGTVNLGGNATFNLSVSGASPINFQWRKDGIDIAGANSSSLTITAAALSDQGNYTCSVSNPCGSEVSNTAVLTVIDPSISFTVMDAQQNTITNGQTNPVDFGQTQLQTDLNQDFTIENTGSGVLTISSITSSDQVFSIGSIPAQVQPLESEQFTVTLVADDPGTFSSNINISTNIGSFIFPVQGEVITTITLVTQPQNIELCAGETAGFSINASGATSLQYQWQEDQGSGFADISEGGQFSGSSTSNLSVANVSLSMLGFLYRCIVSGDNAPDVASSAAVLDVINPVTIISQPTDQTADAGDEVSFMITATGDNLSYQWQKDGVNMPGETSASLVIVSATLSDQGSYTCTVSNSCNTEVSEPATLVVTEPPLGFSVIETQQNTSLNNGQQNPVFFGETTTQNDLSLAFIIENTGSVVLLINDITSSNPVFEITDIPGEVQPQESEQFTITLIADNPGRYSAEIIINTDIETFSFPIEGEVSGPEDGGLIVFNAVAPDGNGKHDFLKIENIESFTPNQVEIYNRWGEKVFEVSGYENQNPALRFQGRSNVGESKDLIEGTYFYVINAGNNQLTGFLVLRR